MILEGWQQPTIGREEIKVKHTNLVLVCPLVNDRIFRKCDCKKNNKFIPVKSFVTTDCLLLNSSLLGGVTIGGIFSSKLIPFSRYGGLVSGSAL